MGVAHYIYIKPRSRQKVINGDIDPFDWLPIKMNTQTHKTLSFLKCVLLFLFLYKKQNLFCPL